MICTLLFCVISLCFIGISNMAEARELRILAVHFPPYEFETPVDGLRGFDVEVVEEAFRRGGKQVVIEFLPWPRAVELAYSGQVFALLTCSKNKERSQYIYFSNVVSQGTSGYFFRVEDGDPGFDSIEDFRARRVAAVRGYATQMSLDKASIPHTQVRTDKIGLNLLSSKRVDFFYGIGESNSFIAKQMGLSDQLGFHAFESRNYHLCVSKKWPDAKPMLALFNRELAEMKRDGSFKRIHDKYR